MLHLYWTRLEFLFLKWADSCYSKRDDIWRPGNKFCRTYDCYWTNIKPLSLSLSLCVHARVTCRCICICVIAPPAPLSSGVSANDGRCLHYTLCKLESATNNATLSQNQKIIVYSRCTINMCSLISHKWWVLPIKLMMGPIIHVKGGSTHLWYSGST